MQEAEAIMTRAEELAKLDALRKSGVLTQEEFEREKERLLSEPGNLRSGSGWSDCEEKS